MALILARGRRRDRFGQSRLEFDDLPAETAVVLTQIVSAGLRHRLMVTLDRQDADRQLAAASAALLARHDGNKRLEALASALIRLLDEQGRLEEDFIAAAAGDGEAVLVAESLARPAAIVRYAFIADGGDGSPDAADAVAGVSRVLRRPLAGPGDLRDRARPRQCRRRQSAAVSRLCPRVVAPRPFRSRGPCRLGQDLSSAPLTEARMGRSIVRAGCSRPKRFARCRGGPRASARTLGGRSGCGRAAGGSSSSSVAAPSRRAPTDITCGSASRRGEVTRHWKAGLPDRPPRPAWRPAGATANAGPP